MSRPDDPDLPQAEDLGTLYRAAPRPEPPAALSEAIRRAAHDAVRPAPQSFAWPWKQGVAVAAVLVLSVSIVFLMPREEAHLPEVTSSPAEPAADDARPRAAQPLPATPPPEPAAERRRQALEEEAAPQPSPPARALLRSPGEADAAGGAVDESATLGRQSTTDEAAVAEEAEQPAAAAPAPGGLDQSYYRSSPELWISHIERLLAEGRFNEAKQEFEAFRERYPQHPYATR